MVPKMNRSDTSYGEGIIIIPIISNIKTAGPNTIPPKKTSQYQLSLHACLIIFIYIYTQYIIFHCIAWHDITRHDMTFCCYIMSSTYICHYVSLRCVTWEETSTYEYIMYNHVVNQIINNPQNQHCYGWYKPCPNGKFIYIYIVYGCLLWHRVPHINYTSVSSLSMILSIVFHNNRQQWW